MYGALTLGQGDEGKGDYSAISRAIGKPENKISLIVILPGTTIDMIVHENVHVQQQTNGTTQALKTKLMNIAVKYKLTDKHSSLFSGIFSAIIEIPAYEKQYDFVKNSHYYDNPERTEAIRDGNDLVIYRDRDYTVTGRAEKCRYLQEVVNGTIQI
jgi:hypothetical protein